MSVKRNKLIQTLKAMHPERELGDYPLGDYDQCAEIDAPDIFVGFNDSEFGLANGLVDPFSTFYGVACEPSHWGLSEEAAKLIQNHNKVYIIKYPACDGPRQFVQVARPDLDVGPSM